MISITVNIGVLIGQSVDLMVGRQFFSGHFFIFLNFYVHFLKIHIL